MGGCVTLKVAQKTATHRFVIFPAAVFSKYPTATCAATLTTLVPSRAAVPASHNNTQPSMLRWREEVGVKPYHMIHLCEKIIITP